MRIAIDVRSLMEGRHSGVEQYTTQIIKNMVRVAPQHSYHLFCNSTRRVNLPDFGDHTVTHCFRIPNKLLHASQWAIGRPRWDRMLPIRPDVVFVPNMSLVPVSPEVPLVTVAHDLSYEVLPEFLTVRRRVWHRMIKPRYLMKNSDRIIAVSQHTKFDLQRLYRIPKEKITVVHSGVTRHIPLPRAAVIHQTRKIYHLPQKYILYFGCLEPRKNVTSIIKAFSAIASRIPHDLVIAGERGWKVYEIESATLKSLVKDRIRCIGFVKEQDKGAVYAGADLFVFPSFYEGFGFPPLEALVAGTPVITSNNSSLPEIVGRWATLIDPYNTSQLAVVMEELLRSPERVPCQARRNIRRRYSWEKTAKRTLNVLEEVV